MVAAAGGEEAPKLEDFLGMQETAAAAGHGRGGSSVGLSMIKNWLRSQPAPPAVVGGDAMMALAVSASASPAVDVTAAATSPDGMGMKTADGGGESGGAAEAAQRMKAAMDTFGQRTSIYRGVTKHRWTGRYEAHLWDNSCRREGQTRKGRQGGYDKEEKAARAYDLAALKYWGTTTTTNFPVSNYEKELDDMKHMNRQEFVASLRRKSSGFSRGASIYRGVTRHHQHGRWQARIGRVAGNKDLYLGTFGTQEEAAEAYDIAAIKFRGLNAVTNFDMSRYDVKSIIESSNLPIGTGTTRRLKDSSDNHTVNAVMDINVNTDANNAVASQFSNGVGHHDSQHYVYNGWSPISMQPIPLQYANGQSRAWLKQEQDSSAVAAQNLHNLHHFTSLGYTHNFFQQSDVPDVTGFVDVPSRSGDSYSFRYNGTNGFHGLPGGISYATPVATAVDQGQGIHGYGEDGVAGIDTTHDLCGSRNVYYLPEGSLVADVEKYGHYGQSVGGNSWVLPTPESEMVEKADNVTVCHGMPLFSVWNDA
uniref:AP2/ERF domain-containing protein n=1 Tax=Oryza punctata TaxID=4537 RepID=A0A0E0MES7_ORYPU